MVLKRFMKGDSQVWDRSDHTEAGFYVLYRGADKSLARPTSRCILFDDENISFDASLFMYINSTNIPPTSLCLKFSLINISVS